ncbi:MAG: large conductance mechanosensitive channel protein MscL [Bacilli bacterium]|nr:large conductance mechanosensitive channel protein MscL [Bacilli bacterium]
MKKFFQEFKKFITRGSVIDLAVGVVIGGAFSKITSSLVADIIMPIISLITGSADVSDWKWVIKEAVYDANGVVTNAEVALRYGNLIQTIIDFIIIGFVIFVILRIINNTRDYADKRKKELEEKRLKKEGKWVEPTPEVPAPPKPTSEELLVEIRDLLKDQKEAKK